MYRLSHQRGGGGVEAGVKYVSNLVFYAQSTITVI